MKMPEVKQQQAEERKAEHEALSTLEKIAKLDKRFGKGVGAVSERAKLSKLLAQEQEAAKAATKKAAKSSK